MSIETTVTRAWQRQAPWLWLLLPVSWLYGLVIRLRRYAYKSKWLSSYRAPIPVMVIGNISVGGSGKTPLIIELVDYLQKQGVRAGVISRGYGGDSSQMPALVNASSTPNMVGDEPCLIVGMTNVPMAVSPNREQAITTLLVSHPDLQLIVADDGLQHYALQRDIEWIVVDAARGFGNEQLLPTGFLREPMSRLKGANVIYHDQLEVDPADEANEGSNKAQINHLTMHMQAEEMQQLWQPASSDTPTIDSQTNSTSPKKGCQVYAVSGIGYPQRFFDTLTSLGFDVIGYPYPDHYEFNLTELLQYQDHPVVVTSKDAVKIRALLVKATADKTLSNEYKALIGRLWVLPVTAVLSEDCYQLLESQLKKLGIDVKHNLA